MIKARTVTCPGCGVLIEIVDWFDAPDGRSTASHPPPACAEFVRRMEAAGFELVGDEDETPPDGVTLQ